MTYIFDTRTNEIKGKLVQELETMYKVIKDNGATFYITKKYSQKA